MSATSKSSGAVGGSGMIHPLTRRSTLGALAGAAAAPWVSSWPARAEDELVVGSWGGVWDDTVQRAVIDPLVAETGADVSILPGSSTDQFAKLLANRDAPPFDVLYIDLDVALPGFAQNLFMQLSADDIPNLANAYGTAIYGNGQAVAASFGGISIVYDSEQIESIDSWGAFTDPANAGMYAVPEIDSWALYVVSAFAKLRTGDENDFDAGWAAMAEVAPQAALMASDYDVRQIFERGEIAFSPMYHGEAYVMYLAGQESIRLAKPKEGMVAVPNMLAIPANARNASLAQRFIHHALAPSAQTIFAEEYASAPSVSGVSLSEELVPWMPFGDEEMNALVRPDWDAINKMRDELIQRWNQEIIPIVGMG